MSEASDRLRQFLNGAIRGPVTDALLASLAIGDDLNSANIQAIHDQLYLITASEAYLKKLTSNIGFTDAINVGLTDGSLRNLAILTTANKQTTQILLDVLEVFYGPEATRGTVQSAIAEPYALVDGDQIVLEFDSQLQLTVTLRSTDFSNIAAATAKEIADAITKQIRLLTGGKEQRAYAVNYRDNGVTPAQSYVQIFSGAKGPVSAVRVLGGRLQNILQFPLQLPTTQTIGTQWDITLQPGNALRFTWGAGTNPSLNLVSEGDIVDIYGAVFNSKNRGAFAITAVQNGPLGAAWFECINVQGVAETKVQADASDLTFMRPIKHTPLSTPRYATVFEVTPQVIQIFMPATSKIIERGLTGSNHIHTDVNESDWLGPYIYDPKQAGVLTEISTLLSSTIEPGQAYQILSVVDAGDFVDDTGYLMFEYGTARQEGPVKYIGRPGNQLLTLDPAYRFQRQHLPGADITYLSSVSPEVPPIDGSTYAFYLTGTSAARLYAQDLINELVATGFTLIITVLYPGDVGLGNAGTSTSDKLVVWGGDPS